MFGVDLGLVKKASCFYPFEMWETPAAHAGEEWSFPYFNRHFVGGRLFKNSCDLSLLYIHNHSLVMACAGALESDK